MPPSELSDERIHVVLVGMMGSGKSTAGRVLAERAGMAFVDADVEIERVAGRSLRDIFETDGERAFRLVESEVLRALLARVSPTVIAAGGGMVLSAENRAAAGGRAVVVWLRAEPETLIERVAARIDPNGHRPLLDDDAAGQIRQMVELRRPMYADAADMIIDIDGLTAEQVADAVLVDGAVR